MTSHLPELQAVMDRLEKVEKQNRVLGRRGIAVLAICGALLFLAAAVQTGRHVLTANEFILQDSQGRTRAKFSVDSKGVALVFLDESGREQLSLDTVADTRGYGHAWLALGGRSGECPLHACGPW